MAVMLAQTTQQLLCECISKSESRVEFWIEFVRRTQVRCMAEIGVYQGDFAATLLQRCEFIAKYYMIDPWKHLGDWNKPANENDVVFEQFFQMAKAKTEFAESRRAILRGKTTDVIDRIPDDELDFAYIDGDHTLRGIAIDLIRVYPKVKFGGFIGGDDFTSTMWQHQIKFEPTLVFPFAVYFAEAVGATIHALPHMQFCLQKNDPPNFTFVDLTGQYRDLALRDQLAPERLLKLSLNERFPRLSRILRKVSRLIP